jgi:hypothetical protein
MVGRWFKSSKSDAQLIKKLNKSGVLNGVGFRTPSQKQNSIDVFEIAGFYQKSLEIALLFHLLWLRRLDLTLI